MRGARVIAAVSLTCLLIGLAGCAIGTTTATPSSGHGPDTTTAPVASVQPPAGWTKWTGGGAEIYLLPSFDLNMLDAKTPATLRAWGPSWEEAAKYLETQDLSRVVIYVGDSASRVAGSLTVVEMVQEKTDTEGTLKEYVDNTLAQSPGEVTSRTDLRLNGFEATRLVVGQAAFSQLMYVVKGPSGFWAVSYTTTPAQFRLRLPGFEKSAATFNIGS